MPELPEVETIVRMLAEGGQECDSLIGKTILRAELRWARTLAEPTAEEFLERVKNQSIRSIGRRAKFVVISLSQDKLLVHLRMSGDLRVEAPSNEQFKPETHDRAVFIFKDDWRLVFNDTRKFGRIWLVGNSDEILGKLGPEPLDPGFTASEFHSNLLKRHRQLKPLLMDQTFLAGLGNIYTDESLYLSRLHPLQFSDGLSLGQSSSLLEAIRDVLQEGIRRNGASIDWVYRGGSFQNSFKVYQRTGKPCYTCGTPIERALVGQRGTHFCPVCQPAEDREKKLG